MSLQIEFAGTPEGIRLREGCLVVVGKYGTLGGSVAR